MSWFSCNNETCKADLIHVGGGGNAKANGRNLIVVLAEFTTLSWAVLLLSMKCLLYTHVVLSRVENSAQVLSSLEVLVRVQTYLTHLTFFVFKFYTFTHSRMLMLS